MPHQPAAWYQVSPELLAREDFRLACKERSFGEVFRLLRKYDGASQDRIASSVEGLTQSRVSRIMRGEDRIASLDLIERVADGLRIPGSHFGLTARGWESDTPGGRKPSVVDLRDKAASPGSPSPGEVRERRLAVDIDIPSDGRARIVYTHLLENNGSAPLTRFVRELWFAVADGPLVVEPLPASDRNVIVKRMHETPAHLTYACQLFPALQPGESATVAYLNTGGVFAQEKYWRQAIVSPVDELSIRVQLRGVSQLSACSAVEERVDGGEIGADESLSWSREADDLVLTLTRRDLEPGQFVSLRWDVAGD